MTDDACKIAEHGLQPYLDRALTADQAALVEEHLAACSYCNDRYAFEAQLRTLVKTCCSTPLPSGFVERVRTRLRAAG